MLFTFPGYWYQTYVLHTAREVLSSGNRNLRHRVLVVCLPDRLGMYGLEFFKSRYNPYWESTEFTLWFPGQLPVWSVGNLFPNVARHPADDLCAAVEAGQYDEVVVLGQQMLKVAEEVIALAHKRAVSITNCTFRESAAYARVSALSGTHMKMVAS